MNTTPHSSTSARSSCTTVPARSRSTISSSTTRTSIRMSPQSSGSSITSCAPCPDRAVSSGTRPMRVCRRRSRWGAGRRERASRAPMARGRLKRPRAIGAREALSRRPAPHRERLRQTRIGRVPDDTARSGHGAHEVMELPLDCGDIRIDVRVVELEIVERERAGTVVHELRALVEECGVVFIRLDHEKGRLPKSRAGAEILRYATDQEAGRKAGMLEYPREHRAGGGLAVRTGNGEYPAVLQDMAGQPFRARNVGQAAIEHRLDHGHAASHDVADDDHIRPRLELRRLEALHQLDAERLELRAHRRIDVSVRTGNAM